MTGNTKDYRLIAEAYSSLNPGPGWPEPATQIYLIKLIQGRAGQLFWIPDRIELTRFISLRRAVETAENRNLGISVHPSFSAVAIYKHVNELEQVEDKYDPDFGELEQSHTLLISTHLPESQYAKKIGQSSARAAHQSAAYNRRRQVPIPDRSDRLNPAAWEELCAQLDSDSNWLGFGKDILDVLQ